MPFVPLTAAEAAEMLERVGVDTVEDLFDVIPADVRFPRLALPPGESELAVSRAVRGLAAANRPVDRGRDGLRGSKQGNHCCYRQANEQADSRHILSLTELRPDLTRLPLLVARC